MSDASSDPELTSYEAALNHYFVALGHFVSEFAQMEAHLKWLMAARLGLSPQKAAAVFSGDKVDAITKNLKRLAEVEGDEAADLKEVVSQISAINGKRNHILHYGITHFRDGNMVSSNFVSAHADRSLTEVEVSPKLLDDMADDLPEIRLRLTHYYYRVHGVPDGMRLVWPVERPPWRYKRP